jgi:hypothetical protein
VVWRTVFLISLFFEVFALCRRVLTNLTIRPAFQASWSVKGEIISQHLGKIGGLVVMLAFVDMKMSEPGARRLEVAIGKMRWAAKEQYGTLFLT